MMTTEVLEQRQAGILLHPTSLPTGDLGPDAYRFVDFLAQSGIGLWQMLPLGPTHRGGSPYHALSLHAGNPLLVSLERLVEAGWLEPDQSGDGGVEYRNRRLSQAFQGFLQRAAPSDRRDFEAFIKRERHWLEDYALFRALRRDHSSQAWFQWSAPLRDRVPEALTAARVRLSHAIEQACFEQFVFARQWDALRAYATERGVRLFGDMPIFVAHDSVDVWTEREYFRLDAAGQPTVVAGVPPDYFSASGQRWGNPLYHWKRMRADGFRWWIARFATEFKRFDLLRVDHFRGFEAYWEIPASETTAVNGRWVKAPGAALFKTLREHFGRLPLVVEDLGLITPPVYALRDRFGMPGMTVLQFAFDGGADNPYLPHNHSEASVVYTGTHDNDTTLAWFQNLPADQQLRVVEYLGYPHEPMPWPLIRAALASVARLTILPMQDILALGHGQRMNTPGSSEGNWGWRFNWDQAAPDLAERLKRLVQLYGRKISEK